MTRRIASKNKAIACTFAGLCVFAFASNASAETLKIVCPAGTEGKVFIDGVELAKCPGELDIQPGTFDVEVVFTTGSFKSQVNLKPGKDSILIAKPPAAEAKPLDGDAVDETPEKSPDTTLEETPPVTGSPPTEAITPKPKTSTSTAVESGARIDPRTYKLEQSQIPERIRSVQQARWSAVGSLSGLMFAFAPSVGIATFSDIDDNAFFHVTPLALTAQYFPDLGAISPGLERIKPFVEGGAGLRLKIIEGSPLMTTPLLARGGLGFHVGRGAIPNLFMGLGASLIGINAATPVLPMTHIEIGGGLNAIGVPLGIDVRGAVTIDRFRAPLDAPENVTGATALGYALTIELQF